MDLNSLNLKADTSRLEEHAVQGAVYTLSRKGKDKRTLHLTSNKDNKIVYSVYDGIEYDRLEPHQMKGYNIAVIKEGTEYIMISRSNVSEIFRWEQHRVGCRLVDVRGVRGNDGREIKEIETLPFLPIVLSEITKCRVMVVKHKRSMRVEYVAVINSSTYRREGVVQGINQRGERVEIRQGGEYTVILPPIELEELRRILTSQRIQHTTRETKKVVKQRVEQSGLVFEIGIKTQMGVEVKVVKPNQYREEADKIILRTNTHRIEIRQEELEHIKITRKG